MKNRTVKFLAMILVPASLLSFQNCGTGGHSSLETSSTAVQDTTLTASSFETEVTSLYTSLFGRAPTASELANWIAQLSSGTATANSIRVSLASSTEAQTEITSALTAAGVSSTSTTGIFLTSMLTSAMGSGTSASGLATEIQTLMTQFHL